MDDDDLGGHGEPGGAGGRQEVLPNRGGGVRRRRGNPSHGRGRAAPGATHH